jgi:hypothetical protein
MASLTSGPAPTRRLWVALSSAASNMVSNTAALEAIDQSLALSPSSALAYGFSARGSRYAAPRVGGVYNRPD